MSNVSGEVIVWYFQKQNEPSLGLEQYEGEYIMTEYKFLDNYTCE